MESYSWNPWSLSIEWRWGGERRRVCILAEAKIVIPAQPEVSERLRCLQSRNERATSPGSRAKRNRVISHSGVQEWCATDSKTDGRLKDMGFGLFELEVWNGKWRRRCFRRLGRDLSRDIDVWDRRRACWIRGTNKQDEALQSQRPASVRRSDISVFWSSLVNSVRSPERTPARLWEVKPMRWSVMRLWGKL